MCSINCRYRILEKLKPGSFGKILLGIDKETNKKVIMKLTKSNNAMLYKESKIYIILKNTNITPRFYNYKTSKKHDLMILEYYGHDLNYWLSQQRNLNNYCDILFNHFDLNTTLIIAYGLIKILKVLHHYNIIYQDIKPDNFLIDNINNLTFENINNHLKIIDFGLSEQLTEEQLKQTDYINKSEKGMISGTIRYCSKNAYNGYEQTYKDDFESIIYLIVYLYQGYLPWQSNLGNNKKDKEKLNPEDFIPNELSFLILHFKRNNMLKFNEKLNYSYVLATIKKYYNLINMIR